MAFNQKEAAIRVRQFLTEHSPALVGLAIPRINALLPVALEAYLRSLFTDPQKRQQLMKRVVATLSGGELNLTSLIEGALERIYLPDVKNATFYLVSTNKPFTWVGTREQLDYQRIGASDAPACFLDGAILYTRNNADGAANSLNEAVYFTVAVFPASFAAIPVSLQMDYVAFAANFIRSEMGNAGAAVEA